MSAWLHEDSIDGLPLTLAINPPLAAAPILELRRRLRDFQRDHDASYLYLQDDLVWGTISPATLVSPQVLHWPIVEASLLVWPLDRSIYSCEVDSTGFVLIREGTEAIEAPDAALERLQQTSLPIVVVPGGSQTDFLQDADFSPNAPEYLSPDICTQSAFRVYTRNRQFHPGHAVIAAAVLMLGFAPALLLPGDDKKAQAVDVMKKAIKVTGRPDLGPQLLALADATRHLEFLQLFGLSSATYQKGEKVLQIQGSQAGLDDRRLRDIARNLGVENPEITPSSWSLDWPLEFVPADSQGLQQIEVERGRLLTLAAHATFDTQKREPKFETRSASAAVELSADGFAVIGPMRYLAQLLDSQPSPPNGELTKWSLNYQENGHAQLSMTASLRGSGKEAVQP